MRLIKGRKWGPILSAVKHYCPRAVATALEVAWMHFAAMVDNTYMPMPPQALLEQFATAASRLRHALAKLGAKPTVWGHIWTVHLPQYLERWRTLYPFLCHGVEGCHKLFKADLRLTTGAQ